MPVYDDQKPTHDSHDYPLVGGDPRFSDKKKKSLDEDELKAAENAVGESSGGAIGSKEESLIGGGQLGKGFNDKDTSGSFFSTKRFSFGKWTRKKSAAVAVTIAVGGGGIFGLSVVQGPMQLVHFSQLLQKFHLQAREDETNSRVVRMGRYMYHLQRDGSGVQNTRLGTLGNKYADRIEKKMNRAGLQTAYTEKSGYRVGYIVDPDNLAGTNLEQYRTYDSKGKIDYDRTTKRVEAAIQREFKEYGVKTQTLNDGTVFFNSNDEKFFSSMKLQKYILNKAGYSKSVSALNARVMGKRAGLTWHPIKKLDRKLALKGEDAYKKWREDRKSSVTGDGEGVSARSGVDATEDTPDSEEADANAADQTRQEAAGDLEDAGNSEGSERAGKIEALQNNKGFRAGAGIAAVTGLLCLVKDVNDGAQKVKEKKVIAPAMKIAGDYLAVGSQVQSGHDIDMTQAGYFVKQMNGKDSSGKKTSWTSSATTRAELGKEGGVPPSDTLKTIGQGGPFDSFLDKDGVKQIVGGACSTLGKIVAGGIGLLTGPISFVVSTGVGVFAGPVVMNQLVDWVSGSPLNPIPVGADLGSTGNYGGKLLARQEGISMGGRDLTKQESTERRLGIEMNSEQEMSTKNIAYRLFNTNDYRSVASQTIDSQALTPQGLASTITSPFKAFGSAFSKLSTPKALAAGSSYDYGFSDVGFSEAELNNDKVENPFKSANEVIKNILPAHPEYIERAKKCFGVEVDSSSYDVTSFQAGTPTIEATKSDDCTDKSDDYLQFRMYVLDSLTMTSLACYEADDSKPEDAEGTQACQDLTGGQTQQAGATTSAGAEINVADLRKDSDNIACAEGTKDLGIQDGYTQGNKLKIRICEIPASILPSDGEESKNAYGVSGASGGAIVNSRVSGAALAMAKAMRQANLPIVKACSSFRTNAHQQALYAAIGSPMAAKPGYSNHQLGVALDLFIDNNSCGTSSYGRERPNNSPHKTWSWLKSNAGEYGYKQLSFEFWHWSPLEE